MRMYWVASGSTLSGEPIHARKVPPKMKPKIPIPTPPIRLMRMEVCTVSWVPL